jgi:hypothetical protein
MNISETRGNPIKMKPQCNPVLMYILLFMILATGAGTAFALKGPEHKTLRPLGMGNAFVAVADDKDALHYNPAGLNLINSLGNRKKRPEMGYYPSDAFDMHMNFLGLGLPLGTAYNLLAVYQNHDSSFSGGLEQLQGDSTLISDLVVFDRDPIPFGILTGGELALHNFGMAYWGDVQISPFVDLGVVLPQGGIERFQVEFAGEIGFARSFLHDRLAIGLEYRLAFREIIEGVQLSAGDIMNQDVLVQIMRDSLNNRISYLNFGRLGHGIDLGALWQHNRSLRFGAVIQNLFMKLNGEKVTPELTLGAALSPIILQNNHRWKRKINFACDIEDILNSDNNWKGSTKINLGMEWEQTLIPYILKGRLSAGLKGGYLTAGIGGNLFSILHYEFATWSEEDGYYTGQKENRYYVMNFGIGF